MAQLSIAQIQDVMRQAGWPEELIPVGSAVAYYESAHGQTCARKTDSVEQSWGLFQINVAPKLGRPWTPAQLCDPVFNAQVAYGIYRQQGWNAWRTTFYLQPQRYRQYLPAAQAAYSGGGGGQSVERPEQSGSNNGAAQTVNYYNDPPAPAATEDSVTPWLLIGLAGLLLYLVIE